MHVVVITPTPTPHSEHYAREDAYQQRAHEDAHAIAEVVTIPAPVDGADGYDALRHQIMLADEVWLYADLGVTAGMLMAEGIATRARKRVARKHLRGA